jgi:hypothetical protein
VLLFAKRSRPVHWTYLASYLKGRGSFLEEWRTGHKVHHSAPSNLKVINEMSYASVPFMCLKDDIDNFTCTFTTKY